MLKKFTCLFWVGVLVILAVVLVVVIQVNSQAGASAMRYWTAPFDLRFDGDTLQAQVVEYDLRFSPSPMDSLNAIMAERFSQVPAPSAPGAPDSCLVTGLEYSAVYWFAIRSRDLKGNWSAWSNIVVDTTEDRRGPERIGDFR